MALGAQASDVRRLVLGEGMILASVGIALGLGVALAAARLLESLLFGVRPGDPLTIASVVVLLSSVAVAAGLLPARRATRVDPAVALRAL